MRIVQFESQHSCAHGNACRLLLLLSCALALAAGFPARAALEPAQVLILVNKDSDISSKVAGMYQKLRAIPNENILKLPLGTGRQITPEQYWKLAGTPIRQHLEGHPAIRCILTTSGVPYLVIAGDGKDEGAAFDNQLADVLREEAHDRKRHLANPLFLHGANEYGVLDPRLLKMVYVVRLDGPDLKTITRMVEDAIATEKTGLSGPVAGDAQGLDVVTGPGEADASIRAAIDRFAGAGFDATLDLKEATWQQPKDGAGTQAAGAAFYIGWYSYLNFQDVFGPQGLARGSIAWHIASGEAQDIWNPKGTGWCINLMRRGAAVTLGPVREPYVSAFPHAGVFVDSLLMGNSIAESYWLALPNVSWEMVVLGDPLYRPFAAKPRPALLATAYVSSGHGHVLHRGETASLLVKLDCFGPAGGSVPPLTATVEPEFGLASALGSVLIPPLKTGESAVVRIPRVTAGDDPTGMFRLRLDVRTEGERSRRIVLEGRTGFSRLTGAEWPQTQMFVNPDGQSLISGQPGRSAQTEINSLRAQAVQAPSGLGLVGAEYSPDGGHVAIALADPQKKNAGVVIADGKLGHLQQLPQGTQFLRWLDKDKVLLQSGNGLTVHNIAGGEDRKLDTGGARSGNVIAGTDVEFLVMQDGSIGIRRPGESFREILAGTKVTEAVAVANDLSLFGGIDREKRLWVQHGIDRQPEIVDTSVAAVLWGPISRRVAVREANRRTRIYDGRDNSWIDLGEVLKAVWSRDEERLLFIAAAGDRAVLSLLSGRNVQPLCDMARIGDVGRMEFSGDGQRAFLLATLGGQADVWMIALPPR